MEKLKDFENDDAPLQIRQLISTEQVGLGSLPEQIVKKRIQEGFVFNILLIGETGIGKSTLISSLFNIPACKSLKSHSNSEVKLSCQTYDLWEKGVNLKLTVVETVGYGDQINRIENVKPIIDYIDSQFEKYFKEELNLDRSVHNDTLIHLCLYFICPTGHNLKSLDVFCMKQLHDKVNIIPLVAKSDSLSKEDLKRFKMAIKTTISKQGIEVYQFPEDDEGTGVVNMSVINMKSNDRIPFAIAASEDYVPVEGELARARIFPWGSMVVEDEEYSEFLALKHALIETNMEDIREKTHFKYYELYRSNRMIQLGFNDRTNEVLSYQEMCKYQREKVGKEMSDKEQQLKEHFIEKARDTDEKFRNLEHAILSKYNTLFEQLKEEDENIRRMRDRFDLEVTSLKKKGKMNLKTK